MIVGISGSIGLSQFLIDSIRGLWDAGGLKSKHPVQGMGILRDTMRPHAVREIQAAAAVRGAIGDHAALQSAVCSTVIAVTLARSDYLFQFDHQAAPEAATEELPFLAIGSGQNIADPFLAFLRSIFWPKRLPVLSEGVLATLWSLSPTIETNPGVADPIQIMTLAGGVIHELDESELLEHRQAIDAAQRSLVEFKEAMASGSSVPAS